MFGRKREPVVANKSYPLFFFGSKDLYDSGQAFFALCDWSVL